MRMPDHRKVGLIGTGMVGMSYAYSMLNQNACEELVLNDLDKKRAEGEAMDLNHGLAFSGSHMKISAGEYEDCADGPDVCGDLCGRRPEARRDAPRSLKAQPRGLSLDH